MLDSPAVHEPTPQSSCGNFAAHAQPRHAVQRDTAIQRAHKRDSENIRHTGGFKVRAPFGKCDGARGTPRCLRFFPERSTPGPPGLSLSNPEPLQVPRGTPPRIARFRYDFSSTGPTGAPAMGKDRPMFHASTTADAQRVSQASGELTGRRSSPAASQTDIRDGTQRNIRRGCRRGNWELGSTGRPGSTCRDPGP